MAKLFLHALPAALFLGILAATAHAAPSLCAGTGCAVHKYHSSLNKTFLISSDQTLSQLACVSEVGILGWKYYDSSDATFKYGAYCTGYKDYDCFGLVRASGVIGGEVRKCTRYTSCSFPVPSGWPLKCPQRSVLKMSEEMKACCCSNPSFPLPIVFKALIFQGCKLNTFSLYK